MPQAHANARSSDRESVPLPMRVYGLEGIVATQDEALGQQAVTLADHETRLRAQEVVAAVQTNTQATMQKALDSVIAELVKTRWTLIGGAITVAVSCIGLVLGLGK